MVGMDLGESSQERSIDSSLVGSHWLIACSEIESATFFDFKVNALVHVISQLRMMYCR